MHSTCSLAWFFFWTQGEIEVLSQARVFFILPVRFRPKTRHLRFTWIWAHRPSIKGSKLLFPVIKAIKIKLTRVTSGSVRVCIYVYTHTHTHTAHGALDVSPGVVTRHLGCPKNPDRLNHGIYIFVYVYKVHMCIYVLGGGMRSWLTAFFLQDEI